MAASQFFRASASPTPGMRVIEPRPVGPTASAVAAWRQRWLVPFFARRFLEKLYARTWLGWLWLPLRPGIDVCLRVALLGGLIGAPSEGVPYLLYALVGLTVWELFETVAYWSTRSIELSRRVLRRVYVPRLVVVLASLGPGLLNVAIYGAVTLGVAGYIGMTNGDSHLAFGPGLLLALSGFALALALAVTLGLFLSVYAAQARDVRFGLAYALGAWFFITPVLYPVGTLDGVLGGIVTANPMTAPVELVKHGVLGTAPPEVASLTVCLGTIAILSPLALRFFSRREALALEGV